MKKSELRKIISDYTLLQIKSKKHNKKLVKALQKSLDYYTLAKSPIYLKDGKTPIILFSAVPCVGRFPAVPKPLRFAFGYWEFLLQKSLILFVNSNDNVFLLGERFPDGKEYFMEDGIHPSKLAYELWSEKLASMSVELLKLNTYL